MDKVSKDHVMIVTVVLGVIYLVSSFGLMSVDYRVCTD